MPHITAAGGVRLYYEEAGQGTPILFVHEFMGEYRSWEAQLRYFSRRYRCIAFNARGYRRRTCRQRRRLQLRASARRHPGHARWPQHRQGAYRRAFDGAFATFYFGMKWPERALSLTLAGIGSGSMPSRAARFKQNRKPRPTGSWLKAGRKAPPHVASRRRGCSCRTRIRAGLPSSSTWSNSTRPRAPR